MHNQWRSVALTDVGRKRTENQDAVYADDNQRVWLVSDGMGGHAEGAAASKAIVNAVASLTLSDNLTERLVQLQIALREVNSQLQQHAAQQLHGQQTGATVVLLTECHGLMALLWAGDSRCYRKERQKIEQISWDHSHLREMVRDGHMTEQEAAVSKLSNVITRAIGPHVDVMFDLVVFRLHPEDCFVLCSDGLTNELTDRQILGEINKHAQLTDAAQGLINETLNKGARDNVSVVLVQLQGMEYADVPNDAPVTGWNHHIQELNQALFHRDLAIDTYYEHLKKVISDYRAAKVKNKAIKAEGNELAKASTLEVKAVSNQEINNPVVNNKTYWKCIGALMLIALALFMLINFN